MNLPTCTRILAFALAVLPACVLATPPRDAEVAIDCAHPALPSQRAVARLTGLDNFTQVYAERTRLMINAQRACTPGVARVRLVDATRVPAPSAPIALADPAR